MPKKSWIFISVAEKAALAIASFLILVSQAEAGRADISLSSARHDENVVLVRVEGALSCEFDKTNTGGSCLLKLREAKTGKTFEFEPSESITRQAMSLYLGGTRDVAVEGTLGGSLSDVIRVQRIGSL